MFFPSEKREDDQKEMKGKAKEGIPDLDVLLFLHRRDARPSHVLLFMSEHSRGAFDFLLSSGPAIVFTLGYKPLSAHCFLTRCFSLSNFPLCTSLVIPPQKPSMMKNGSLAVAIVHRQVVVVKGPCSQLQILLPFSRLTPSCLTAVRSHTKRDRLLDVCTFTPIGDRLFIASDFPNARIPTSDILTIFPFDYTSSTSTAPRSITSASSETLIEEAIHTPESITVEMLELPSGAFAEFQQLCSRSQELCDKLWVSGQSSNIGRKIKSKFPLFR